MFNIVGGNDLTLQEVSRLHINSAALDLKSFSRHTILELIKWTLDISN